MQQGSVNTGGPGHGHARGFQGNLVGSGFVITPRRKRGCSNPAGGGGAGLGRGLGRYGRI